MAEPRDALERIAAALERLAPPAIRPQNWSQVPAFIWSEKGAEPIHDLAALPLATLRGIDQQKAALRTNITRLAEGSAAHDMLLWGARGMGKSALIRSCVSEAQMDAPSSIALVQIQADAIATVPTLLRELAEQERAFVLFLDDLGFGADQKQEMLALRSLLDGGLMARGDNIRICVTSNRRAIIARDSGEAEALHERDERDDALALADRFGLKLGFHPCDKATYLEILRAYTDPIGLSVDEEEAMAWAISRGNRSGRTAYQFATELAGRAGKTLDL